MSKERRILSRDDFFDMLDAGHEEFRIKTITPGKNKREISEDAPFDRDDPMSYVLVDLIFDKVEIYAKGEFSAHDIAESERKYGMAVKPLTLLERMEKLETELTGLQKQIKKALAAVA